jgi:hypothetical protein
MRSAVRQRILVGLFLVAACAVPVGAQTRDRSRADDNLYTRALAASRQEIIKQYSRIDDSLGLDTRVRTDWKKIIVERFPEITPGMPEFVP